MDLEIKENTSIKYQDNGNKIFAFVFPLQKKVRRWPCVFQIVPIEKKTFLSFSSSTGVRALKYFKQEIS